MQIVQSLTQLNLMSFLELKAIYTINVIYYFTKMLLTVVVFKPSVSVTDLWGVRRFREFYQFAAPTSHMETYSAVQDPFAFFFAGELPSLPRTSSFLLLKNQEPKMFITAGIRIGNPSFALKISKRYTV